MKKALIFTILLNAIVLTSCSNSNSIVSQEVPKIDQSQPVVNNTKITPEASSSEKANVSETSNTTPKVDTKVVGSTKISNSSTEGKERDWFYEIKTDGTPSGEPKNILDIISKHDAYYLGDTSKKIIYLTFDEGYENGYSSKILDILKEKNVKAAFFVTTPYINSNKDLLKRMATEGHLVCNHSNTHPSMAEVALKSKDNFTNEFISVEKAYKSVTGQDIGKFFRPPMGKYSELSLKYTDELKYKTIFWSFAYNDWDPEKQPEVNYAKKLIMERTHPGGIYLLHAVSKTNTEILPWLIDEWTSKGYTFKSLNELPDK